MEIQLLIKGDINEIRDLLGRMSPKGLEITGQIEEFEPVMHMHPHDLRAAEFMEMGSIPVPPMKPAKKYKGKRERTPDDLQVHCHFCGHLFHPKFTDKRHCSEKCYQAEWYELHRKPTKLKTDKPLENKEPVTTRTPEQEKKFQEKIRQIKDTFPAPAPRPNISRNLLP